MPPKPSPFGVVALLHTVVEIVLVAMLYQNYINRDSYTAGMLIIYGAPVAFANFVFAMVCLFRKRDAAYGFFALLTNLICVLVVGSILVRSGF